MDFLINTLGWVAFIAIILFVALPLLFKTLKGTIFKLQFNKDYLRGLLIYHKLPEKVYLNDDFLENLVQDADKNSKSYAAKHMFKHCRTKNQIAKEMLYADALQIKSIFDELNGTRESHYIGLSKRTLENLFKYEIISNNEYNSLCFKSS